MDKPYRESLDAETMTPTEGNLVSLVDACPTCSERDCDMLVWDEWGEVVRCAICGCIYVPAQTY